MTAAQSLPSPLPVTEPTEPRPELTPEEAAERLSLREQLRTRRSVDHVAQGWYGGIGALILTGLFARSFGEGSARWVLVLLGAAAGFAWGFAAVHARQAFALIRLEGVKLDRLATLDARAPKPPELF